MTMRVTIENADGSGRVLQVKQEDRLPEQHDWQRSDITTLQRGERRSWYIHVGRRLVVTEEV